jgi:hypothetical protein
MPDALPDATLPISRLGTGSTNGSTNGRGWGISENTIKKIKYKTKLRIDSRGKSLSLTRVDLNYSVIFIVFMQCVCVCVYAGLDVHYDGSGDQSWQSASPSHNTIARRLKLQHDER